MLAGQSKYECSQGPLRTTLVLREKEKRKKEEAQSHPHYVVEVVSAPYARSAALFENLLAQLPTNPPYYLGASPSEPQRSTFLSL